MKTLVRRFIHFSVLFSTGLSLLFTGCSDESQDIIDKLGPEVSLPGQPAKPRVEVKSPSSLFVHEGSIEIPLHVKDADSINVKKKYIKLKTTGSATANISVMAKTSEDPLVLLENVSGNGTLAIRIEPGAAKNSINEPNEVSDLSETIVVQSRKAYATSFSAGVIEVVSLQSNAPCVAQGDPDDSCTAPNYPLLTDGVGAYGITMTNDDRKAIVTQYGEDQLIIIDTLTDTMTTLSGFDRPIPVAVTPDSISLYVGNFGDYQAGNPGSVDKIDLRTNERCISYQNPSDICVAQTYPLPVFERPVDQADISSDGRFVAMALHNGQNGQDVLLIDTTDDSFEKIDTTQERPSGVVFTQNDEYLLVSHEGEKITGNVFTGNNNDIAVIDMATKTKRKLIDHPGIRMRGIAYDKQLNLVYVADNEGSEVYTVDMSTLSLLGSASTVGSIPLGIVMHPYLYQAFVANVQSNSISVIDTITGIADPLNDIMLGSTAPDYLAIQKLP